MRESLKRLLFSRLQRHLRPNRHGVSLLHRASLLTSECVYQSLRSEGTRSLRQRSTVVSIRLRSTRLRRIRVSCAKRSFISCESLKPQDHVAVYGLTTQLLILHDFTRDSADLVAAANKFSPKELAAFDASAYARH